MQNEEPTLEIQILDHLQDERRISRVVGFFENVKELLPTVRQSVVIERIDGKMRREISELRTGSRIRMRADDDAEREDGRALDRKARDN